MKKEQIYNYELYSHVPVYKATFGLGLWHIKHWVLSNAKSCSYIYVLNT